MFILLMFLEDSITEYISFNLVHSQIYKEIASGNVQVEWDEE